MDYQVCSKSHSFHPSLDMFSSKFTNLSKITSPIILLYAKILQSFLSCTPFAAIRIAILKRFACLSDAFYTQCLTWDRKIWLPNVTQLRQLKAFHLLTILLLVDNHILSYILGNEVLGYHKDSQLTFAATVLLVISVFITNCALIVSQIYAFQGKTVCFIYRNVEILKKRCQTESGKYEFMTYN